MNKYLLLIILFALSSCEDKRAENKQAGFKGDVNIEYYTYYNKSHDVVALDLYSKFEMYDTTRTGLAMDYYVLQFADKLPANTREVRVSFFNNKKELKLRNSYTTKGIDEFKSYLSKNRTYNKVFHQTIYTVSMMHAEIFDWTLVELYDLNFVNKRLNFFRMLNEYCTAIENNDEERVNQIESLFKAMQVFLSRQKIIKIKESAEIINELMKCAHPR